MDKHIKNYLEDLVNTLNENTIDKYTITFYSSPFHGGKIVKNSMKVFEFTEEGVLVITPDTNCYEEKLVSQYNEYGDIAKYLAKKKAKRMKTDHVINLDDNRTIMFKSVDDLLLYSATSLQRKIDENEYKNHDQLIEMQDELLKITDRISKTLDSKKINDAFNKEISKMINKTIDELY